MIQVNRIYLIFNRLVTKKFLVDTSDIYQSILILHQHLFEVYQNIENIIHIILFLLKKKIYCVKGHLDELYED